MAGSREIPQMVTELIDMSKEYLRQETLQPAKDLGRFTGLSLGAAVLFSFAAMLLTLGLFTFLRRLLPDTQWGAVLARLLTTVGSAAGAGLIVWRMSSDDHKG